MALVDPPMPRRWDGRTKTATAWNINTQEPDLCPTAANCSIYLSDSQQPNSSSLKVTFDQLVLKKCQPLLKNLTLDFTQSASDTTTTTGHLDRSKASRASWDVPLSSWTCSLTLPPPKFASEDDALLYNVTTRNFFAWMVDAPIVGYNPTSALVALKSRMDIWRAPSCDNVAALQSYAASQSYGYLAGLHLVNTSLLRSTPFIPADYTLTSSTEISTPPASDNSKPLQLGLSLRKRAGSMLRRKPEGAKVRESFSSRPSSAPIQSSVPDNDLPFMSGALSHDMAPPELAHVRLIVDDSSWLGSAYDAISDNGKSSSTSTTTERSTGQSTVSSKTTTDTLPDMPELEATYSTVFKDFAQPSTWLPDLRQNKPQVTNSSLHQSPTSIDPPRPYSNANNRHSYAGDRRRQSSRSRPPSPIMEEVVEPVRKKQANNSPGTFATVRRQSLPPVMNRSESESSQISAASSIRTVHRPSQEDVSLLLSTKLSRLSTDSTATMCANCNRCKKPCSPATHVQLQSPAVSITRPVAKPIPNSNPMPNPNLSDTPTDTSVRRQSLIKPADTSSQPFLSEGRWLSAKSKSKELLREEELTRFPSLRRRGRSSTAPSAPDQSQDADARIAANTITTATNTGRLRSASQAPPVSRSIISEPVRPEAVSRRSLDQAPLSEQRYSSPMFQSISTGQHHNPRTETYDLTGQRPNLPTQTSKHAVLRSPIRIAPATERRTSHESARRQALQLRISTPTTVEDSKRISPDVPSFPEPMSSVIMTSNGKKISLALPHDDSSLLSLNHPFFAKQAIENITENKDHQLVFEQLLDGLQFIQKSQPVTPPEPTFKAPPKKEADVTTGFPRATSKAVQEDSPESTKSAKSPKSPATRQRRFTLTETIRGWLSKDKGHTDTDQNPMPRTTSKGTECQVRVLTLDSQGRFSTSMMDSPGGAADLR